MYVVKMYDRNKNQLCPVSGRISDRQTGWTGLQTAALRPETRRRIYERTGELRGLHAGCLSTPSIVYAKRPRAENLITRRNTPWTTVPVEMDRYWDVAKGAVTLQQQTCYCQDVEKIILQWKKCGRIEWNCRN